VKRRREAKGGNGEVERKGGCGGIAPWLLEDRRPWKGGTIADVVQLQTDVSQSLGPLYGLLLSVMNAQDVNMSFVFLRYLFT